jgi:hypothetical protein
VKGEGVASPKEARSGASAVNSETASRRLRPHESPLGAIRVFVEKQCLRLAEHAVIAFQVPALADVVNGFALGFVERAHDHFRQ